jgi:hypothetical protein
MDLFYCNCNMYKTLIIENPLTSAFRETRKNSEGYETLLCSLFPNIFVTLDQWKTDFAKLLAIEEGKFYRSFQRKQPLRNRRLSAISLFTTD